MRAEDLVAHVGGEEFAVLLPDLAGEGAVATTQRVRLAVRAAAPQGHDGLALTVSIGVASARPGDSVERLLAHTDEAITGLAGRWRRMERATDGRPRHRSGALSVASTR